MLSKNPYHWRYGFLDLSAFFLVVLYVITFSFDRDTWLMLIFCIFSVSSRTRLPSASAEAQHHIQFWRDLCYRLQKPSWSHYLLGHDISRCPSSMREGGRAGASMSASRRCIRPLSIPDFCFNLWYYPLGSLHKKISLKNRSVAVWSLIGRLPVTLNGLYARSNGVQLQRSIGVTWSRDLGCFHLVNNDNTVQCLYILQGATDQWTSD